MVRYLEMVVLLNFLVDFLLLLGTNRLCGYPPGWGRSSAAAAVGSLYAAACLTPEFRFLSSFLWRAVFLCLMGWCAFGCGKSDLRRTIIFAFLCMALEGAAQMAGGNGFWQILISAAAILLLCLLGFQNPPGSMRYVPVELTYGENVLRLTALCDTGNTLRDPVTGRPVLVVAGDVAQKLTGLTAQQLRSPIGAVRQAVLPGLRLIPYKTVAQPAGMLLGMQMSRVRIGKWQGSSLVAFAPEGLSVDGQYQALTGGIL